MVLKKDQTRRPFNKHADGAEKRDGGVEDQGWRKASFTAWMDDRSAAAPAGDTAFADEYPSVEEEEEVEEEGCAEEYKDYEEEFGDDQDYPREEEVDVWEELFDEKGRVYYFNRCRGESRWEAPEWVEETDPASQARWSLHRIPSH